MLYGVKKIEYCAANALTFSGVMNEFYGLASELSNALTAITDFVRNRTTLSIEETIENKEIIFTTKLSFVTPCYPNISGDGYAFVVTTNSNERILVGAQFRPRVMVTTVQTVSATAGELTAFTTTAEWRTNYRPLRLPVTAIAPIAGPALDICCGQVKTKEPISGPVLDICCGAVKTKEPISGPTYDICCGEIVGEIPPVPPPPIPTAVFIQLTASDLAPWMTESYMPNISTSELTDTAITIVGTSVRLAIAINPAERSYEVLALYLRRVGTLLSIDISAMQAYSDYHLINDPIDNSIPIGYCDSHFPSNKIAVAYGYEANDDQFFSVGVIYSKNAQIQDISDPNNTTGYIIEREGYHCVGWSYRPSGNAVTLGAATRHIILYAIWEADV